MEYGKFSVSEAAAVQSIALSLDAVTIDSPGTRFKCSNRFLRTVPSDQVLSRTRMKYPQAPQLGKQNANVVKCLKARTQNLKSNML